MKRIDNVRKYNYNHDGIDSNRLGIMGLSNKNPYVVFNKLMLFTAEAYLSKAIEDGLTDETIHKKIVSGIRSYMVMSRFDQEEAKILQKLGEHEYMENLKKSEIAFVVYALEILRLYIEEIPQQYRKSIYLGVSNRELKKGRAYFAINMLRLKQRDAKQYEETRIIIDESVLTAKKFFMYCENQLVTKKGEEI